MILYFSGTGNSRYVAENLGALLGERLIELRPSLRGSTLTLDSTEQRVVWVYPIYSWGIPPYILEMLARVRIDTLSPLPHHAVVTCGDDCGRADVMWRHALRSHHLIEGSMWSVQMPNNYVSMKGFDIDSPGLTASKLAAAPERIAHIASAMEHAELEKRQVTDIVRGRFARFKTGVIYPWFVRHAMDPSRFSSTDACTGCGTCAKECPLGNITITDGRPQWGNDCSGCLACYHVCPCHAVAYGKATRDKGQYLLKSFIPSHLGQRR